MDDGLKLLTLELPFGQNKVNAFALLPAQAKKINGLCSIAHGFTSHKGQLLNWGARLAEEGIGAILFDWPGHFQGSLSPSGPWDYFIQHIHLLPGQAMEALKQILRQEQRTVEDDVAHIYAGHSLGALMSLKAMHQCSARRRVVMAVGFGRNQDIKGKHFFESPLFKSTLHLRAQLVDAELAPGRFFSWIDEEKEKLLVSDCDIYLLCGQDDLVVGKEGLEWMQGHLERQGNRVVIERPLKLPHHEPELAAGFLKKYLKNLGVL